MAMASPATQEGAATQSSVLASPPPLPLPQLVSPAAIASAAPPEVWTNLCISTLLEEYESVLVGLGRGHLRLKDWEAVCRELNRRIHGCRTPEQCKAKIDNLKKHYRRERLKCSTSPFPRPSRWIFYHRLRQLAGDPLPSPAAAAVAQSFPDAETPLQTLEDCPVKWDANDIACASVPADDIQARVCAAVAEASPVAPSTQKNATGRGMHVHDGAARDAAEEHPSLNIDLDMEAVDPPKSQLCMGNGKSSSTNHETASLGRDFKEALSGFAAVMEKIEVPDVAKEHPSPNGAPEAVDPPKSQPSKAGRKSYVRNCEMASLGRDLKEALSSFAEVIEKIERAKMELIVLLQTQRLEQERQHAEMEMERTRLIMASQLDLAKLICVGSRKDIGDREEDGKDRKRGRRDAVSDTVECMKTCKNNAENICVDGEEIIEHENQLVNGGKGNCQPPVGSQTPSPSLRRDSLQFESEDLNFRANGVPNGTQDFRSNGIESTMQNWRRNEPIDCAENFRQVHARDEIRQEIKHLTHWETGRGIMQIEHLNN